MKDEGTFICSIITLQMALAPNTGHPHGYALLVRPTWPRHKHAYSGYSSFAWTSPADSGSNELDPLQKDFNLLKDLLPLQDQQTQKDLQLLKDYQTLKDHPNALNREFHSSTITASTKASLTALTQKIKLTAARGGMRCSIVEAVRLTPLSYESWRGGREFTELRMDQSTYDQIVRALSGRSLLIEEIAQLLEHQGLGSESSRGRAIFNWPICKGI